MLDHPMSTFAVNTDLQNKKEGSTHFECIEVCPIIVE